MKNILFLFSILLLGFTGYNAQTLSTPQIKNKIDFELTYITIGFGQNKDYMQPAFSVQGTKFVFTYEEMWGTPGQKR